MVQKTDRPQRGRPPRFDEGDVVAGALIAFWSHGYEGTTLAELERAPGDSEPCRVERTPIHSAKSNSKSNSKSKSIPDWSSASRAGQNVRLVINPG